MRRAVWMGLLLVVALAGLGARLVELQLLRHEELATRARRNVEKVEVHQPLRGEIKDVRGNSLATTMEVKTIGADPSLMVIIKRDSTNYHHKAVAAALSRLMNLPEDELVAKFAPVFRANSEGKLEVGNKYVALKRKVSVQEWEALQTAIHSETFGFDASTLTNKTAKDTIKSLRDSVVANPDWKRVYPNGPLAAHVLGYVSLSQAEMPDGKVADITVGASGIEREFDKALRGIAGWVETESSVGQRRLVRFEQQNVSPRDGHDVVLTLDAGVQYIVETALAEGWRKHTPISISATVVRPATGEILAMATLPNYDPNNLANTPQDWMRNRVITDRMEPGSTFKIVVVGAGLNEKMITLQNRYDCENGRYMFRGRPLTDHHGYGILSVEDIIAKSSNIGSAKIGIQLGEAKLYDYIKRFGFGPRTGITLPGEVVGDVPHPKKWDGLAISRIPMGHSMDCTSLQMVMAMSAVANGGRLMRPMIVSRLESDAGPVPFSPVEIGQAISPEAAAQLVTALKKVVTKDGTADGAALEHFTVAGKTGTAQKVVPGQGYVKGKFYSSFIGFFPADAPELCISVVLDDPKGTYYGGQTAAPIFRNIAERAASYLKLKPDRAPAEPPASAEKPLVANRR